MLQQFSETSITSFITHGLWWRSLTPFTVAVSLFVWNIDEHCPDATLTHRPKRKKCLESIPQNKWQQYEAHLITTCAPITSITGGSFLALQVSAGGYFTTLPETPCLPGCLLRRRKSGGKNTTRASGIPI